MPKLLTRPKQDRTPADDTARTRKRFLRRQRARRWVVVRRVLAVLAVVGLVVGGVWLVFFSSVLAVHQVDVQGTDVLTAEQVEQAADVPHDVPLATSDLAAVKARVEELAPVESAAVSRSWPDTITIDVTERTAVAVVDWEGSWRGLDEAGVLFRSYPKQPHGLPRLAIRADTSAEALSEAARVVVALPADVAKRLDHVEVGSVDAITVHLKDGVVVQWGSADQSEDKARVLEVLMEQDAREYNVTAPGRPTLTP